MTRDEAHALLRFLRRARAHTDPEDVQGWEVSMFALRALIDTLPDAEEPPLPRDERVRAFLHGAQFSPFAAQLTEIARLRASNAELRAALRLREWVEVEADDSDVRLCCDECGAWYLILSELPRQDPMEHYPGCAVGTALANAEEKTS
jgi:hypothetical protein